MPKNIPQEAMVAARLTRYGARRRDPARRRTLGQALAETALSIVLLVGLTFSVIDAAVLFFVYLTLENGVTEAARYAVTFRQESDDRGGSLSRDDSIKKIMRDKTPGMSIPDSEFSFFNITDDVGGTGSYNDVIRVTVTHPWQLMFPVLWPLTGGGQFNLRVSATMKNEPSPI